MIFLNKSGFIALGLGFLLLMLIPRGAARGQHPAVDSMKRQLETQQEDTNKIITLLGLSGQLRFSLPDTAEKYATTALALSEKLKYDEGIFWSMVAINSVLLVRGDFTKEIECAFKIQPIAKRLHTVYSLGFSNGMLSDCYYSIGEYDTSLLYWHNVIRICEDSAVIPEYASVYGNASRIYSGKGWYDSALFYARKGYDYFSGDPRQRTDTTYSNFMKSNLFTMFGEAFNGLKNYDSALFYYRQSLSPSRMTAMDINTVDSYNGMATLFQEKNQPDSAIRYGRLAIGERLANRYPAGMLKSAESLARSFEALQQQDSALKYMHLVLALKDSLFNRSKMMAFQNIVLREKEKQTELVNASVNLRRQYRTYLVIAMLIAGAIILVVAINNRRLRNLQQMRNSIADDLHDDIGSALSSISILSELAKTKSPESGPMLNSISESTMTIQENMSDIVWAVNPGNDVFENVFQRMHRFASELLEAKNIELEFRSDPSLAMHRFTMKQRKNLYLFFKEAVNNAAKYSGAKRLSISITKKDNWIDTVIIDNGIGFDSTIPSEGNGLRSLARRAAELNGIFSLDSTAGEGTSVRLKFKPGLAG